MPALRGQGNADDPATMYTETHGQYTPGPWQWSTGDPDGNRARVYKAGFGGIADVITGRHSPDAALIAVAPWHALLLKAVLKGWRLYDRDRKTCDLVATTGITFESLDIRGSDLPACPDAETYERIRKAVEGE